MDLPRYSQQEMEEYQEVCPICNRICEPGAMLYCSHYIGVMEAGDLIWIPSDRDKTLKIMSEFCCELENLFVDNREIYTSVINLIFDANLKNLISAFENFEFGFESYISGSNISSFAEVHHPSNLFHGLYVNHFNAINALADTITEQNSLFKSLVTVVKAGYEVNSSRLN